MDKKKNAEQKLALQQLLLRMYKELPLEGVITDYELSEASMLGDTILMMPQEGPSFGLTLSRVIYPDKLLPAEVAKEICATLPPPWKAFAAMVVQHEKTGAPSLIYGAQAAQVAQKAEDVDSLNRLHRLNNALDQLHDLVKDDYLDDKEFMRDHLDQLHGALRQQSNEILRLEKEKKEGNPSDERRLRCIQALAKENKELKRVIKELEAANQQLALQEPPLAISPTRPLKVEGRGSCGSCAKWSPTGIGKGECMRLHIIREQGFYCSDYVEGTWMDE